MTSLNRVLKKFDTQVWAGPIWFRMGSTGRIL